MSTILSLREFGRIGLRQLMRLHYEFLPSSRFYQSIYAMIATALQAPPSLPFQNPTIFAFPIWFLIRNFSAFTPMPSLATAESEIEA